MIEKNQTVTRSANAEIKDPPSPDKPQVDVEKKETTTETTTTPPKETTTETTKTTKEEGK